MDLRAREVAAAIRASIVANKSRSNGCNVGTITAATGAGTGTRLNCAVTVVAVLTVMAQVGALAQPPPLQPVNVEPAVGVAVSTMTVFGATDSLQSAPQAIPVPVTVPKPVPDFVTVNNTFETGALSVAQIENSDVPLTACVAVALINPVTSAEAKLAVPAA